MKESLKALSLLVSACLFGCRERDEAPCLQQPWVDRKAVGGVSCAEEREFGVVLPGSKTADGASASRFLDAHRSELHALGGIVTSGVGSCCAGGDWPDPKACIVVGMNGCSHHASELIELFRGFQASSDETSDVAFQLSFEIQGLLGPRCERSVECGPEPYHAAIGAKLRATRTSIEPAKDDTRCAHDGECLITGCGDRCDHWTNTGRAGTCKYRDDLKETFCGCVEQQCAWFK